ncbi:MAG: hypothetical protein P8Z35_07195 [Ignavibacteriaceae bacterium]|jgi:hypothetical protein
MIDKIRKTPVVCLIISIGRLLFGRLRLTKNYLNKIIQMDNENRFVVFRHISTYPLNQSDGDCVFIVSFKFAHLSHKANKLTSIIPMLMIAGFPGFIAKIYAVNFENGYWQGMYQWKSFEYLEAYKKSFVFKMMNKRAIQETIKSVEMINQNLIDIIETEKVNM